MLTFTEQEMAIIIQGLGKLPAEVSYALIKKIEAASEEQPKEKSVSPDLSNS